MIDGLPGMKISSTNAASVPRTATSIFKPIALAAGHGARTSSAIAMIGMAIENTCSEGKQREEVARSARRPATSCR